MDIEHVDRIAVYTDRPEAYSEVDALILSYDAALSAEEFLRTKEQFLDNSQVIVVDFADPAERSPTAFLASPQMSYLTGALKRLVSGRAHAAAGIGVKDIPVEQLAGDTSEKTAVIKARQEFRVRFLQSANELQEWLDLLDRES